MTLTWLDPDTIKGSFVRIRSERSKETGEMRPFPLKFVAVRSTDRPEIGFPISLPRTLLNRFRDRRKNKRFTSGETRVGGRRERKVWPCPEIARSNLTLSSPPREIDGEREGQRPGDSTETDGHKLGWERRPVPRFPFSERPSPVS